MGAMWLRTRHCAKHSVVWTMQRIALQEFKRGLRFARSVPGAMGTWQRVVLLIQWSPFFTKASLLAELHRNELLVTKHIIDASRQHFREYKGQPLNHPSFRLSKFRMRLD